MRYFIMSLATLMCALTTLTVATPPAFGQSDPRRCEGLVFFCAQFAFNCTQAGGRVNQSTSPSGLFVTYICEGNIPRTTDLFTPNSAWMWEVPAVDYEDDAEESAPVVSSPPPTNGCQTECEDYDYEVRYDEVSDIRLKTDLTRLATLDSGLDLYAFRYIGDDDLFVGVMAQDVLERPELASAVSVGEDGYYRVNYAALGLSSLTSDAMRAAGQAVIAGLH